MSTLPKPEWIRAKAPTGEIYEEVKSLVESARLHTVCQSANCPNIGECWREKTATFMILGNTCTRNCRFCAVDTGVPGCVDEDEPGRVAEAVAYLGLRYAVITSVTRDDQPDGGAHIFAETITQIHHLQPDCKVEVLIPDFKGNSEALKTVLDAQPYVLNHNIETVERCYPSIRPQAIYRRSLDLLKKSKQIAPDILTKSGIMVGVGETSNELLAAMKDLRESGCDLLTVGQYLAPSAKHHPVERYYTPEEFDQLRDEAIQMGFTHAECGPLVRSSYHADRAG
jgi:lipoic acid synthetase